MQLNELDCYIGNIWKQENPHIDPHKHLKNIEQ